MGNSETKTVQDNTTQESTVSESLTVEEGAIHAFELHELDAPVLNCNSPFASDNESNGSDDLPPLEYMDEDDEWRAQENVDTEGADFDDSSEDTESEDSESENTESDEDNESDGEANTDAGDVKSECESDGFPESKFNTYICKYELIRTVANYARFEDDDGLIDDIDTGFGEVNESAKIILPVLAERILHILAEDIGQDTTFRPESKEDFIEEFLPLCILECRIEELLYDRDFIPNVTDRLRQYVYNNF